MFIRSVRILLNLTFLIGLSFSQQRLTVGIIGDQFGSYNTDESYQIMDKAIDKINLFTPDILIHVGDMVESIRGINDFEDYRLNFQRATEILNKYNTAWIVSIGDHGVVPPQYKANSTDRSREEWFLRCSKLFKTPINDIPYYSTDIKGYHFIALYSLEHLHTDPRWGSIFQNKISELQLSWLQKDLEKNKKSKGIIVLIHHPMWYVWSNWMEVHNILKEYPVISVIAGHYHYDQDEGFIDGIRYLVMGSTGGVVKDTDANTGGIQEYGIMKINNDQIDDIKLYEVNSDSLLELTPRISTDRIQAISCMLDNLFGEISLTKIDNKIYVKGKDGNNSEFIELTSISNPIDLPIEIEILSKDSSFIDQVWYVDDSSCAKNKSIKLKPGYNVDWANYSNVGQWFKHPKIWHAKINENIDLSDTITLSFIIKFKDTKERTIKRDITYSTKKGFYQ